MRQAVVGLLQLEGVFSGRTIRWANSRSRALGGDVTGNGISKLVFTILLAEAERDRIRERVHDVKRDQKERHRNAMKKFHLLKRPQKENGLIAV